MLARVVKHGTRARMLSRAVALLYLAVLLVTALGHHCGPSAAGAEGKTGPAIVAASLQEGAPAHRCLACAWLRSGVSLPPALAAAPIAPPPKPRRARAVPVSARRGARLPAASRGPPVA